MLEVKFDDLWRQKQQLFILREILVIRFTSYRKINWKLGRASFEKQVGVGTPANDG